MKVIVFGAGVIGVTTAYYLARAGHEVEVIDRGETPACETSFANAGQISPGYASPWAGPGVPLKALKWLTMRHWLEENPDDDFASEVRTHLTSEPKRYAEYTREYLGWGVFALMAR